jgi:hypothetical protein
VDAVEVDAAVGLVLAPVADAFESRALHGGKG